MASISFQVLNSGLHNLTPDAITTGSAAPTTGNAIELRIDLAGGWNVQKVIEALEALENRITDGRFTQNGTLTLPST